MQEEYLRTKFKKEEFRFSSHAEDERRADLITFQEALEAGATCEIIENYPDDPRGPSCLILGFTQKGDPIHIVCAEFDQPKILLVTIYRPDPRKWINFRIRI